MYSKFTYPLFFRWYEKTLCHLKHPAFYGHVHLFILKSSSFSVLLNTSIHHPSRNTCGLFLGTKANWSRNDPSHWFTLLLAHVYLTTVSSVGAVWEVHAYINENSTHRSETNITDKCFKILFLIFLHPILHEKCIYHGIKYKRHDTNLISCTTVLDDWIYTMLISMKNVYVDTI